VRPRAILIEKNAHLREQIAEALSRMGIHLAASYDQLPATRHDEITSLRPELVVFPMKQAHAGRWRLVRDLRALPVPPVLIALTSVDIPAIRQGALDHGVDHVFDPLLELDSFLGALRALAEASRQLAS